MKRKINLRNRYLLLGDVALIIVSVLGSYAIRLELSAQFFYYLESAIWMIGISMVVKPLTYYFFGLYRRMWAYASVQELKLIALAVSCSFRIYFGFNGCLIFSWGFHPVSSFCIGH